MRQGTGFIIILLCFPLLWILYSFIHTEVLSAASFNDDLEHSIQLSNPTITSPVVLLDKQGEIFSEDYVEWREPIELETIPLFVQELFIQSEDVEFYNHIGFNFTAIFRAVFANASSQEREQGASTITQQLVRLRYLSTEKTYERKLTELLYAHEMEKQTTKEEILTNYLNEIYFSNQVYGIGAAATFYFGRPIEELRESELAFISAIPNNPTIYNPLTNFEATKKRQELLIDVMVKNGRLTAENGEKIKKESIVLSTKLKKQLYPAYSTFVLHELENLIAHNEGFKERIANSQNEQQRQFLESELKTRVNEVIAGGITISTALDQSKQDYDERYINSLLSKTPELQAASVVINNESREIVSVYGGKDYRKMDFHRAYQAVRQPGSAFKPLLVYAPLFETTTYTPANSVNAGKLCIGSYCPQNYGGVVYGDVTIQDAFRLSHNTPAVRLLDKVGIENAFARLSPFQFEYIQKEDYTYSAALGGLTHGVTIAEMADAYTSFINGTYKPVHSIRKVEDKQGNVLYRWDEDFQEAWSYKTAQTMRGLLQQVVTNGTGKGIHINSSYVGAKTGTTNEYYDYWLAGLTDTYTSAVWIGYDKPKNMKSIESNKIHHRIFNQIMKTD
ncbi:MULTISPECIES: transglycosylase domain-containing protein [Psychrobacillus]|uniref:Transglycosylase domain-containing protein n=1 Tax=Psychrobacillus faecigallinarum TaxID=2762235 RepID=A0ABR8RDF0_9BACI|nr:MULTISPECIES: transglycosylase domain-containing protein [Psychrobacillus]MBD7945710.1 transglycosylase domain-containing protein [Psychrobacillus faecigallinarum]QEY22560.1 penicillin-binding protein [Psychrobacillus sp. AK 1817]QGM29428.1 penicillin-binding protein [Bacillus sp. N3536]